MKNYLDLMEKAITEGLLKSNRTGINHIGIHDEMLKFDLSEGFPIVTTKKFAFKACIAEMLCFLRGCTNAADFRKMGCKVWDQNANKNKSWLDNPNRKGIDDLGPIYGAQARNWDNSGIDQLRVVYDDLRHGIDNRREIVTHWNPSRLNQMALPPCHLLYQFGIHGDELNLIMYQRSCDMPLGVPFNITGYAWLLSVFARITGYLPGTFTHVLHDIHVYENQIELARKQIKRIPLKLPYLEMNSKIVTLKDLETWVTPDDFGLVDYESYDRIDYLMAV